MPIAYSHTLVPDSPWRRLSPTFRRNLTSALWLVTWGALILGFTDLTYWKVAIAISAAQALLVTVLVDFRPLAFPAQLRIAYVGWLTLGTFVPQLVWMMYVTTAGVAALLAFGYCPLARMLYLLPWNRTHDLSRDVLLQIALQAPQSGRFALSQPQPTTRTVAAASDPNDVTGGAMTSR